MVKEEIFRLYQALGVSTCEVRDKWVNGNCPYAFWKHSKGTDNNPSAGIVIDDEKESVFRCWSCGKSLAVSDMIMELQFLMQAKPSGAMVDFKTCWEIVASETEGDAACVFNPVDYEKLEKSKWDIVYFPEQWLNSFFILKEHNYLTARGVSKALIKRYRLTYDISDQRVCFPIRDFSGRLTGLQGRSVLDNPELRYRYYKYKAKSNNWVWGGEQFVSLDAPVVLCEGFFDLLSIASVYPNVLCSFTSALTPAKLERIQDADQIITFYDFGTGGDTARKKLKYFFGKAIFKNIIPTEEEGDAGAMSKDSIYDRLKTVIPWLLSKKGEYI